MAGAKEIRTKIKSVKNTQKITRAMEKVAMSKMRKAQDRMSAARPYAEKIRRTLGHLAQANLEYKHPFTVEREVKRVVYLIVSSDRGLCGGLNMNAFRTTVREVREWRAKGVEVDFALIGGKAISFFRRMGGKVLATSSQLGDRPHLEQLLGVIKVMTDAYRDGSVDRVLIVSNQFVNTMTQKATPMQLLPLEPVKSEGLLEHWDYIYEPASNELMDSVLMRYIESQVYQAVIENAACEQSARMVAMKSASDNAGKIIGQLELAYNKARQANITKELAEIVGGAAAVG
ncbi:F0F1 ATP synthase subunit gamma [Sinimarinibacterium sp. CAU 1509]|uniref:F0F1 ATP synthase subunit gamma n=1 Tax=Sinimarinibacterium sp. CAU 1509 TaxID=2562283 RepID=UPI0010AB75A7|nr:F0F1 ATP synthase subunit gamma [Sinimarinibacterium sp. CAU 1509]TJY59733.1 F0F1 ATP synthase subunit gamma [Sinimarinibacterium sp. CAU 1509]